MRSNRVLVGSVLFLAVGLGLIFGFCNGTTGFTFGYPFSATSLHIDITTTGVAALAGLALTGLGCLLLLLSLILAFAGQGQTYEAPIRRGEPFEE
ncbi:MAG: hypothetical protein WB608_17830 [Terracidiphilus sp.]